jgi:hypothetical protein
MEAEPKYIVTLTDRKESPWKLLVVVSGMASWIGLIFCYIGLLLKLGLLSKGNAPIGNAQIVGEILLGLSGLFALMPIGFFCGNVVGWYVPLVRRALNAHASKHGNSFSDSCYMLLKFEAVVLAIAIPTFLFGFIFSGNNDESRYP